MEKIKSIMTNLRENPPKVIANSEVVKINDYKASVSINTETGEKTEITLPSSNVLSYFLKDGSSVIVRPSGTEPKIKLYIGAMDKTHEKANIRRDDLQNAGTKLLGF